MSIVLQHKIVASLPAQLQANSIYYVRVGSGFDQYITNSTGTIVAYESNADIILEDILQRVEDLENTSPSAVQQYTPAFQSENILLKLAHSINKTLPVSRADGITLQLQVTNNG